MGKGRKRRREQKKKKKNNFEVKKKGGKARDTHPHGKNSSRKMRGTTYQSWGYPQFLSLS